jgi:hypothetical protein
MLSFGQSIVSNVCGKDKNAFEKTHQFLPNLQLIFV